MQGKKITIISETEKGFFQNVIGTALTEDGFEQYTVASNDPDLERYIEIGDISLILLTKDIASNTMFLGRVKKKCLELNHKVFLYGTTDELFDAKASLSESVIAGEFVRPLENKDIVNGVNEFFSLIDVRKRMKRVLVVDDSGMMLRTILGWLEGKYQVSLANSAASAFKEIQKNRPDLILLDYEMPVCTGAQFMEMLTNEEDTKDIPVVFLTARDDTNTVSEVLKLRPAGYLLKTTPEQTVVKFIDDYFTEHGMN